MRLMVALAFTVITLGACNSANASNGAGSAPPNGSVSGNSLAASTSDSAPHGGIGDAAVATQAP